MGSLVGLLIRAQEKVIRGGGEGIPNVITRSDPSPPPGLVIGGRGGGRDPTLGRLCTQQYIDRTDQGGTRPSLFQLSKRSEKVVGVTPRLFTMRRKVE